MLEFNIRVKVLDGKKDEFDYSEQEAKSAEKKLIRLLENGWLGLETEQYTRIVNMSVSKIEQVK